MNDQLKVLLDASEKANALQNEIINKQKTQISNLNRINQSLEKENQKLKRLYAELQADYSEVVSMCRQQQELLNSFLDQSE